MILIICLIKRNRLNIMVAIEGKFTGFTVGTFIVWSDPLELLWEFLMRSAKCLTHKIYIFLPPDFKKLSHEVFLLLLILERDKQIHLKHVFVFVLI